MSKPVWLRELDPRNDLSRHAYDTSLNGRLKNLGQLMINQGKCFVRGTSVGAIVGSNLGALVGVVNGEDIPKNALYGAMVGGVVGMEIDLLQYQFRYLARDIVEVYHKVVYGERSNDQS